MTEKKYEAAVFDLDGTLADTMKDIALAANNALVRLGKKPKSLDFYRQRVGWGVRKAMELTLPGETDETIDQALALCRRYYDQNRCVYTEAYPGIPEMLEQISLAGLELYVYTNKPEPIARDVVDALFGSGLFKEVFGAVSHRPLKPGKEGIRFVIDATGFSPEQLLYVGDSEVDMETAAAGGLDALAVTWGFRSEEQLRDLRMLSFVRSPEEITAIILKDGIADPVGSLL